MRGKQALLRSPKGYTEQICCSLPLDTDITIEMGELFPKIFKKSKKIKIFPSIPKISLGVVVADAFNDFL